MSMYYGGSTDWQKFLTTESLVQSINGEIRKNSETNYKAITKQTQQIVASNKNLSNDFQEGFDQVSNSLSDGFGMVSQRLEDLNNGIENLGASFEWGMSLLAEQLAVQNQLLIGIREKLDAIHDTLQNPILTQARELYIIGQDRLKKGLLNKALEAFLQAEAKNDTDFLIQWSIGHLYLYGLNEDDNVLDTAKSVDHFCFAARYAKTEISSLPEAQKYCGKSYFHAAIAYYIQACEAKQHNDIDRAKSLLNEATTLAKKATDIYPQFAESFYLYSKLLVLTCGDLPTALASLVQAIKTDRNYTLKVDLDSDFDTIRPQLMETFEDLRQQAQVEAQPALNVCQQLLDKYVFLSDRAKQLQQEFSNTLNQAAGLSSNGTYFDYLDYLSYPVQLNKQIQSLRIPTEPYKNLGNAEKRPRGDLTPLSFSPDEVFLVTSDLYMPHSNYSNCKVQIWNIVSGKIVATLKGYTDATFSPDGKYLAAGDSDDRWYFFEFPSIKEISTQIPLDGLRGISFSPDGKYLAAWDSLAGGRDGTTRLWEISSGKEIDTFVGRHPCFSLDGRYIATMTPVEVHVWNYPFKKSVITLTHGKDSGNQNIEFSPDGQYLLCHTSRKIYIWEVITGQEICNLEPETELSVNATFNHDGKYVAITIMSKYTHWTSILEFNPSNTTILKSTKLKFETNTPTPLYSPSGSYLAGHTDMTSLMLWGQHHVVFKSVLNSQTQTRQEEKQEKRQRQEQTSTGKLNHALCKNCGKILGFYDKLFRKNFCKKCR